MSLKASQMSLPFPTDEKKDAHLPVFDDPAFMDNRTAPVHRWVPWIAGFSGAFVDSVLSSRLNKTKNGGLVLDPFAGVGTTLLQASLRGHRVVGFEINPYAALAANVKLKAFSSRPSTPFGTESWTVSATMIRENGDTIKRGRLGTLSTRGGHGPSGAPRAPKRRKTTSATK